MFYFIIPMGKTNVPVILYFCKRLTFCGIGTERKKRSEEIGSAEKNKNILRYLPFLVYQCRSYIYQYYTELLYNQQLSMC